MSIPLFINKVNTIMHDELNHYIPDYTKTGKELLIDLINWSNRQTLSTPLKAETTWFTKPVKNPRGSDCNTSIRFSNVIGFRTSENPIIIDYNRLNIKQLALQLGFDGQVEVDRVEENMLVSDLLESLFKAFPVKLTTDDIENTFIISEEEIKQFKQSVKDGNYIKVTIKISDFSIAYLGDLEITLIPKHLKLDTAITSMRLPYSFKSWHRNGLS